jgi:ectoine hydroxylase-related dioxygenase (phytanoyl-CoA dioxygenase family)
MALTQQQISDFRECGYFNLGSVFDTAELDTIRAAYDAVLSHPLKLGEHGKGHFEFSPLLHVQNAVLCHYAASPRLVEPVMELIGPNVRLYWDQAVSKPPGATSDVPWHQDNGYTPVEPAEYVTCTLALDAMDTENGCLWIIPGSHHRGVQPHRATDFFFQIGYDGAETGTPCELRAGDVLVFSSLTLHRTGPNLSQRARRSWVIQYCHGHACHGSTYVPFDDRLLVAKDGYVLAEPYRERELDLATLLAT